MDQVAKKLTKILLVPIVELILTKSSHFCCPQKGLCQASKHTEPKIWTLIQWCETGPKMDQVPKKTDKNIITTKSFLIFIKATARNLQKETGTIYTFLFVS